MIPLSVYLGDLECDRSLPDGFVRYLNNDPLTAIDNPFALLGTFAKVQPEGDTGLEDSQEPINIMKDYTSPLMLFKSYRLNPNYPLKLNSNTHSHKLDPFNTLCKYV